MRGPCPDCRTEIIAPIDASESAATLAEPVTASAQVSRFKPVPVSALTEREAEPPSRSQERILPPPDAQADPAAAPGVAATESIVWPPPAIEGGADRVLVLPPLLPEPETSLDSGDDGIDRLEEKPDAWSDAEAPMAAEEPTIDALIVADSGAAPVDEPPAESSWDEFELAASDRSRFRIPRSALIKYAAAVLVLAGIGATAIKFWPEAMDQVGDDASIASLPESATPLEPSPAGIVADATGFSYSDEPGSKSRPVLPPPDARFRTETALSTDAVKDFMVDTTGDKGKPVAARSKSSAQESTATADPSERTAPTPREVLEKALAAGSVEELSKLSLAPERVLPKMRVYYGGRSPALTGTSIIYETSATLPDSEFSNHTFFVSSSAQPIRFPVAIEDTAEGPRLDWESFIELHDDRLGKFLTKPESEPQTFHVILERRHYFDTDVPKLGSKDCFRISTPIPGSEGYGFVDVDSPTAAACKPFEWDRLCFPIATLRWVSPPSGKPYLEITEIVQTSWRARADGVVEVDGTDAQAAN